MWLTLDIGNSAAKGALFDGAVPKHVFHLAPTVPELADGTPAAWTNALQEKIGTPTVKGCGVASVVPAATDPACAALEKLTGTTPLRLRPSLALPIELAYETPETLGADRIAAAIAAWLRHGDVADPPRSVIALDAGTALTYEVVRPPGVYEGGVIAPGLALMQTALHQGTAQLPQVDLETIPDHPVGCSTASALQSGLLYGYLDGVAAMINRIGDTLDEAPAVVVTGGHRSLIHAHVEAVEAVDPHLVLHGIRLLLAYQEG